VLLCFSFVAVVLAGEVRQCCCIIARLELVFHALGRPPAMVPWSSRIFEFRREAFPPVFSRTLLMELSKNPNDNPAFTMERKEAWPAIERARREREERRKSERKVARLVFDNDGQPPAGRPQHPTT